MKKAFSFLLLLSIFFACKPPKPPTPKELIMDILANYASYKSVSFDANYRVKPFSNDKPNSYTAHCILIKDAKDSVFGGYLLLSFKNWGGVAEYYDLNKIYHIHDSTKEITEYDNPKTQRWSITGNFSCGVMELYFLDSKDLEEIRKDSTIKINLSIDKIGYEDYWKVNIKYPDDKEFTNKWRDIWVNRKDTTIRKMDYHVTYQGQDETKEWDIDSMVFDKATPQSLADQVKGKLSSYPVSKYAPPPPGYYDLLENGTEAPAFTGTDFETNKEVKLSKYKGKVTMLDFWYMDCGWCITAMPDIEKVRDDYKSKGLVVLGMNHYDTSARARTRLPGFMSINKMNYPVILTSYKTDSAYKVKAYPTLYVIDKKGKIIYSQRGYKKGLDSILAPVLAKALGK